MERNLKEQRSHSKNGSLSGNESRNEREKRMKSKAKFLVINITNVFVFTLTFFSFNTFEMKAIRGKRNKKRDARICLMLPQ